MSNKAYEREDVKLVGNEELYHEIDHSAKGLFYAFDDNDGDGFWTGIVNIDEGSTDFENFSDEDACIDYLVDVANRFVNGEI